MGVMEHFLLLVPGHASQDAFSCGILFLLLLQWDRLCCQHRTWKDEENHGEADEPLKQTRCHKVLENREKWSCVWRLGKVTRWRRMGVPRLVFSDSISPQVVGIANSKSIGPLLLSVLKSVWSWCTLDNRPDIVYNRGQDIDQRRPLAI